MTTPAIRMYATHYCPYCVRAEQLLRRKGIAVIEKILIDNDPALRDEMMRVTGRRTVPQIFIGDTHVGGCDDLYALEREGKLDALLGLK
ncbi:glutaredoxin 3 [Hydrogenophilus thermoluteolus]|uniref:Glutaredoxin n=1 Tax=Hydrogenophilus thermoluteolus TaxID=297 RepID=A0A2Z6DYI7_HYDTE|nr:glutaredoxin 3 [Hydrogenophilus thermoluteolus]BBD77557.1 glutaredoxin [Hydrogenophilus thermoluteolus]GLW59810.1 glutaredoxin [Hydrogenophilus thermoluteolus]